ncbi:MULTISPECIES: hypothetical protein [unclassified Clostridium]|uniref:hypothetical protein n=1 Tax=unclassified Clostridium TaxID=2614128 RepID=UPI0025C1D5A0|nr:MULTISPECIES: hypothetical protein [unclassified Clostridium]
MKEIMKVNLEVKLFKYSSEKEMEIHIGTMIQNGWNCKRKGKYMFIPSSLISDYCNEDNWEWSAEFSRENKEIATDKSISYDSEIYYFMIYESEEE